MRAPSTWIYLAVSLAVFIFAFVMLNTLVVEQSRREVNQLQYQISDASILAISWRQVVVFLLPSIAMIGFIAVKVNQIFRNDIDEGTLLILISKPISRNRIWLEKWLAFMSVLYVAIPLMILLPHLVFLINGPEIFWRYFVWALYLVLISLLIILVISSIALCISLAVGAGGTVALVFLFVLAFALGPVFDSFVTLPDGAYLLSYFAQGHLKLKNKLPAEQSEHYEWMVGQTKDKFEWQKTEAQFQTTLEDIYHLYVDGEQDYSVSGQYYEPEAEQAIFTQIAEHKRADQYPDLSSEQIDLITHAYYLSEALRTSKGQGYLALFTSTATFKDAVQTDVVPLYTVGSLVNGQIFGGLDEKQHAAYEEQVFKKRILKYLNVLDHLSFLWRNVLEFADFESFVSETSVAVSMDNPAIVGDLYFDNDTQTWRIDLDKLASAPKLVNYWAVLGFYSLVAIGLLVLSWQVFKKRDFA